MRITAIQQLEAIAETIGDQNTKASRKLLADNGKMWFFQTLDEVQNCPDLNNAERENAQANINELSWAIIIRSPQSNPSTSSHRFRDESGHRLFDGGHGGGRNLDDIDTTVTSPTSSHHFRDESGHRLFDGGHGGGRNWPH